MKKYQFKLNRELFDKASLPIRTKLDLIRLLLHSVKFISTECINEDPFLLDEKLILYVDKMSRLIFCIKDKIFSFQFPFNVKVLDSSHLSISYPPSYQIDSISSSLLLAIFNRIDILNGDLDTFYNKMLEEIVENKWPDIQFDLFFELVKDLMLFEPGYLRYDHDKDHENGALHPEHHIDFYFSSNNQMKLGLKQKIHEKWLLDMLNILTNCKYIQ